MLALFACLLLQGLPTPREQLRTLLSRIEETPTASELTTVVARPEATLVDLARDQNEHGYVRERAIHALGAFKVPWVEVELGRLLRDRAPVIWRTAAYVLGRQFGQLMPDDVFASLEPMLKDPHTSVRRQAVRGLSHVPKKEVVAALTQRLALEQDAGLRELIFNRALQLQAAFKPVSVR